MFEIRGGYSRKYLHYKEDCGLPPVIPLGYKSCYSMFEGCKSLTTLDLSNFDTSQVKDMAVMFGSCKSLTTLDLSNFDTSRVRNMYYMFDGCESLTEECKLKLRTQGFYGV